MEHTIVYRSITTWKRYLEGWRNSAFRITNCKDKYSENVIHGCVSPAVNSLLSIFQKENSSVSIMYCVINVVTGVTKLLNLRQTIFMWMDQVLYTAVNPIHCNLTLHYGEISHVLMFAPFHVEKIFLRIIRQLLGLQGMGKNSFKLVNCNSWICKT